MSTVSSSLLDTLTLGMRAQASSTEYFLPRSTFSAAALYFLPAIRLVLSLVRAPAMARAPRFSGGVSSADDLQPHRAGGATDAAHGRLDVGGVEIRKLGLGDLPDLLHGDLADLVLVRLARPLLELGGLHQQDRRRRRLGDEGEAAVRVRGDEHGDDDVPHALGARVELLAELHDVEPVLAERGPHRRRRVGLACRTLELDEGGDFLHGTCLLVSVALRLLDLGEVELDGGGPPEDRDEHLDLLLVRLDLLDGGREARERAVDDADRVALLEDDLRLGLALALGHGRVDAGDVLGRYRGRVGAAEEAGDLGGVLDQVEGPL